VIELELLRDQDIVTVSPTGPLSEADFARLAREVATVEEGRFALAWLEHAGTSAGALHPE
jgi:hypothetical protein